MNATDPTPRDSPPPAYLTGNKKRVAVAMSGGVDSATSALLLKREGHEVFGIFMKNWEEEDSENYCHAAEDLQQAEQVCDQLSLPLRVVNFSAEYWDEVFQSFVAAIQSGLSPNPDIRCNETVKFHHCLKHARHLGADRLATGHYAGIMQHRDRFKLHKGADDNKDQSYFLCRLTQEALKRCCFPLAQWKKPQVRQLAAEHGLENAQRKDSYGICFIGERGFADFLKQYIPCQEGDIVDTGGQVLGQHSGVCFYTIGQRKGLGVGGSREHENMPWYVADKKLDRNELVVVQGRDHPALYHDTLVADDMHWIDAPPEKHARLCAKVRHRQDDQPCQIHPRGAGQWEVRFTVAQRALAPGQHVVLYEGQECLGGGVIRSSGSTYNDRAK